MKKRNAIILPIFVLLVFCVLLSGCGKTTVEPNDEVNTAPSTSVTIDASVETPDDKETNKPGDNATIAASADETEESGDKGTIAPSVSVANNSSDNDADATTDNTPIDRSGGDMQLAETAKPTSQEEQTSTEQPPAETTAPIEQTTPLPVEREPAKQFSEGTTYVLNTNTKKFHYPWCASAKKIKESNKQEYSGTRDEVIQMGYDPCKNCNP